MGLESAIAFAAAMFVFALIPGPGVMALVGRTLAHGVRPGLVWAAGELLGDVIFLLLAVYGLGFIASELSGVFMAVRILGGAYLVYLGACCLLGKNDAIPDAPDGAALRSHGDLRGFAGGMCVSLGNPKVIAFYCGFLPTFMDMAALRASDVALVAALVVSVGMAVLAGYVLAAASGRRVVAGGRFWKGFNRGAGALMIGTGVAVAVE